MSHTSPGQSRTIVLRLWFERSLNREDEEWRGEARDVLTGSVRYFRHLTGVEAAVGHLLRLDEPPRRAPSEEVG